MKILKVNEIIAKVRINFKITPAGILIWDACKFRNKLNFWYNKISGQKIFPNFTWSLSTCLFKTTQFFGSNLFCHRANYRIFDWLNLYLCKDYFAGDIGIAMESLQVTEFVIVKPLIFSFKTTHFNFLRWKFFACGGLSIIRIFQMEYDINPDTKKWFWI